MRFLRQVSIKFDLYLFLPENLSEENYKIDPKDMKKKYEHQVLLNLNMKRFSFSATFFVFLPIFSIVEFFLFLGLSHFTIGN